MAQIPKEQGAIKLSEISSDLALSFTQVLETEDNLTVIEKFRRASEDLLRKNSLIIGSTSAIDWNGPASALTIPAFGSIFFNFSQMPTNATLNSIRINLAADASPITFTIADNEVVYLEMYRSTLDSAAGPITLTDGINAAGTPGNRIRKATLGTLAQYINDDNGTTLLVPVIFRHDDTVNARENIYWMPHGILWSGEFTARIGTVMVTSGVPIGAIVPIYVPNTYSADIDQAYVDANYPGWQLCDGSLVTEPSSPFVGAYTPNLMGNPQPASGLGTVSRTVTMTAGSNIGTVTSHSNPNEYHYSGQRVFSTNLPANTTVTSPGVNGADTWADNGSATAVSVDERQVVFSQNAIASGSFTVVFGIQNFMQGQTSSPNNGYGGKPRHALSVSETPAHSHESSSNGAHRHIRPDISPTTGSYVVVGPGRYGIARTDGTATGYNTGSFSGPVVWGFNHAVAVNTSPVTTSATGSWSGHRHGNNTEISGAIRSGVARVLPHNNVPQFYQTPFIIKVV